MGEQANFKPICNQTNYCVLYVGQNQNDFTAPKVFSAPFLIAPGAGGATNDLDKWRGRERARGAECRCKCSGDGRGDDALDVARELERRPDRGDGPGQHRRAGGDHLACCIGIALLLTGAVGRRRCHAAGT